MKQWLIAALLIFNLAAWSGTCPVADAGNFVLPKSAAPGGRVTAKFSSSQPICLRLNGLILGYFQPHNGVVEADLTAVINYQKPNKLTSCPAAKLLSVTYQDAVKTSPLINRLRREKIRMNSSAAHSAARAKQLRDSGFNVIMGWSGIHNGVNLKKMPKQGALITADNLPRLRSLRRELQLSAGQNLLPMPLMWYHKETQKILNQVPYEKCRSVGYGVQNTPCPLDATYWDRLIKPTLKLVAGVYRELNVPGGMTLDQEFYGCGYPGFTYGGAEDGCYCDSCMKHFFAAVGEKVDLQALKKKNRLQYVIERGYSIEDYLGVLQVRLTNKMREVAAEVRQIKPDFLFGLMPGMQNWYTIGLARGMAAPGLPVFILNEGEYYVGFNAKSAQNMQKLRTWGLPAFYLCGMVISSYNAEGLGVKSVDAAQKSDGYWLYYGEMLFKKPPVRRTTKSVSPTEYALRDTQSRYLAALKKSNAYLTQHPQGFTTAPQWGKFPQFDHAQLAITAQGIKFRDRQGVPKNLLNTKPKYVKRIERPAPGQIRFNMKKWGSNEAIYYVKVTPGQTYKMALTARAAQLSMPFSGFHIKANNKRIARQKFNSLGAAEFQELSCNIVPKVDKLKVTIFAFGETGNFEYKPPCFAKPVVFSALSRPTSPDLEALQLQVAKPLYAELVNPVTKQAYFRLIDGVNDWRLLRQIYGPLPQKVRIFGELTGDVNFSK